MVIVLKPIRVLATSLQATGLAGEPVKRALSMIDEHVALPLLTVGEAARYLGVGRRIIYQLIERGEIKAVRVDGSIHLEQRSLEEYRASGKLS